MASRTISARSGAGRRSFFSLWGGSDAGMKMTGSRLKTVADLLRRAQVAVVDGIESAPEESDFFHRRICPEPETMNFKVVRSSTPMGPNE